MSKHPPAFGLSVKRLLHALHKLARIAFRVPDNSAKTNSRGGLEVLGDGPQSVRADGTQKTRLGGQLFGNHFGSVKEDSPLEAVEQMLLMLLSLVGSSESPLQQKNTQHAAGDVGKWTKVGAASGRVLNALPSAQLEKRFAIAAHWTAQFGRARACVPEAVVRDGGARSDSAGWRRQSRAHRPCCSQRTSSTSARQAK